MRTLRHVTSLTAAVLAFGLLSTGVATADIYEDSLSTKTNYVAPTSTSSSAAPAGFTAANVQVVARHGSRGLSSFKYDALTEMVWAKADELGAVLPAGEKVWDEAEAMHQANLKLGNTALWAEIGDEVELSDGEFEVGYGNLTSNGAAEHEGLGSRLATRLPSVFDDQTGTSIDVVSSGEPRAAESGWHFRHGLLAAAPQAADNVTDTIRADVSTLYFHKDEANADYAAYTEYQDSDQLGDYVDAVWDQPQSKTYARAVLERIYTKEFVDSLANGEWTFETEEGKKVKDEVDAAVQLYNLYIIAPGMKGDIDVDFSKYFTADEARWFAMLLDSEDYAEKGPGFEGSDISYRNAQPLLEDFFAAMDEQVAAFPNGSATLRFGHAETLIPFEALIKAPGSETQISTDDVDFWGATTWRGAEVSPMAANIQWEVWTDARGQRIVRMLLNEVEVPFNDTCRPIETGSTFYTEDELKRCLTGATVAANGWQLLPALAPGLPSTGN